MTEFEILRKPEYFHVALNHLTIYGVMLGALAVAGLVAPVKWPKVGVPLTALTLAGALACSGLAVYISQAGGSGAPPGVPSRRYVRPFDGNAIPRSLNGPILFVPSWKRVDLHF
jgi:hypothetical protein